MLLRGLEEHCLVGVSGRAVVVVYVDNGLVWQFSRGEYSTGISPSPAVDPLTVKAVQVPGQRKHDRTLRLELDYNPCGTSLEKCDRASRKWAGKIDRIGGLARAKHSSALLVRDRFRIERQS